MLHTALSWRWLVGVSAIVLGVASPGWADAPPEKVQPFQSVEERLRPRPPVPIPDDPPPHEGALIDLPYVVGPPDLILVEVLEALPGRPISGERLVRPDGTIDLGFYGNVHVRGLTLVQVKEKLIRHLRTYLSDETLGLMEHDPRGTERIPPLPGDEPGDHKTGKASPSEPARPAKPSAKATEPGPSTARPNVRPTSVRRAGRPVVLGVQPLRAKPPKARGEASIRPASESAPAATATTMDLSQFGGVKITVEVQRPQGLPQPAPAPTEPEGIPQIPSDAFGPADSTRVLVDVTAYNSKTYYVQGDVAAPGILPWTGRETVLDALNYAGGLIPSAEPKNIRLIRPARGGKPAKVYPIDYAAILEKGDASLNYQIFPGDRLLVGRNEVVQKTIQMDRLGAAFSTVFNSMLQYSFMARSVASLQIPLYSGAPSQLTQAQREAFIKEWVDMWWKAAAQPGGVKLDEKTFREMLERHLAPAAGAPKPEDDKK